MSSTTKIKWTIVKKVSITVTVLLSVILALLTHSIFALQQIEHELTEVATIDVPLTEHANEIEIAQLEQRILLDQVIRKQLNKTPSATFVNEEINQLSKWSSQINQHFEAAIAVAQKGKVLFQTGEFDSVAKALSEMSSQHQELEHLLRQILEQPEQEHLLEQFIAQDEKFDLLAIELIHTIESLTSRKANLVLKHETQFAAISYSLGAIGLIIGVMLASLIIFSIRRGMKKLSTNMDLVSKAIQSNEDIPVDKMEQLESGDEFGQLSQNFSKMVEQVSTDIDKREQKSKDLETLASRDHLTGCFNRMKWDEYRQQAIVNSSMTGMPLSLLFLDIDHFKSINDNFGHDIGDTTLVTVADIVQKNIRQTDSLFRTGGEEFAVLLPEAESEEARLLAERIREKVAEHKFEQVNQVTISLGATTFRGKDDNESELCKRADQALYHAKRSGRNRVSLL